MAKLSLNQDIIDDQTEGGRNKQFVHCRYIMKVSVRWVQKLHSRYRSARTAPAPKRPGIPKKTVKQQMIPVVADSLERHSCCAIFLERIIDAMETHMLTAPYTRC